MRHLNFKVNSESGRCSLADPSCKPSSTELPHIIRVNNIPDNISAAEALRLLSFTAIQRKSYIVNFEELGMGKLIK